MRASNYARAIITTAKGEATHVGYRPRKPPDKRKRLKMIDKDVRRGLIARAFQELRNLNKGEERHLSVNETAEAMRKLNPKATVRDDLNRNVAGDGAAEAERQATIDMKISKADLKLVIKRLETRSSHGSTGWTFKLIKSLCGNRSTNDLFNQLLVLFNRMLKGEISEEAAEILGFCRGTLIGKPDGTHRPICISCAVYRLFGKVASDALSRTVGEKLAPVQLALGIRNGCEIGARNANLVYHSDGRSLVKYDVKNAFNTIPREVVLDGLKRYCPELVKWFKLFYGRKVQIRKSSGEFLCFNETGVRQGDPLSLLCFAVGLHDTLMQIRSDLKEVDRVADVSAFADDITIDTATGTEERANDIVRTRLEEIGLQLKTEGVWANKNGGEFVLLGIPIGDADYQKRFLDDKLKEWTLNIGELAHLSSFAAYKLLYYCYNAQPVYVARVMDWVSHKEVFANFDSAIDVALAKMLGLEDLNDLTKRIRDFNQKQGGLGLYRRAGLYGQKGFAQSKAATRKFNAKWKLLEERPHLLRTMDSNCWRMCDLENKIENNNFRAELPVSREARVPSGLRKLPGKMKHSKINIVVDRWNQMDWETTWRARNVHDQAQLRSQSCDGSAHWVTHAYGFTNEQWVDSVRWRLLISPFHFRDGTRCKNKTCGVCPPLFQEYPTHAFDCKATAYFTQSKHNRICDIIGKAFQKLYPTAKVDREVEKGGENGEPSVRADVVATLEGGDQVIVEVSVVNPSCPSNAALAAGYTCGAAQKVEARKTLRYAKCGTLINDYPFVPFIVESTGRLGQKAFEFVKLLTQKDKEERKLLVNQIRNALILVQARQFRATRIYVNSARNEPTGGSVNGSQEDGHDELDANDNSEEEEEDFSQGDVLAYENLPAPTVSLADALRARQLHRDPNNATGRSNVNNGSCRGAESNGASSSDEAGYLCNSENRTNGQSCSNVRCRCNLIQSNSSSTSNGMDEGDDAPRQTLFGSKRPREKESDEDIHNFTQEQWNAFHAAFGSSSDDDERHLWKRLRDELDDDRSTGSLSPSFYV
jgi:hypothetical protein